MMLLISIPFISYAQSKDSMINYVKVKYQHINQNASSFTIKTIDTLEEESTEGGTLTGYYDGKNLKLMRITYYGETGKNIIEYFFDNDKVFFAFEKKFTYNRPIYWDKKHMEEHGDSAVFDPSKSVITEDRYYFYNEKLFRWVDQNHKEVDLEMGTNPLIGPSLISYASINRKKLESK